MSSMDEIKERVGRHKKWGFLAPMLTEVDGSFPFMGVDRDGYLRVVPSLARELSDRDLVKRVRHEFAVAAELRRNVRGFQVH